MNNIKIKLKTSELTGAALDWAVALIEFPSPDYEDDDRLVYVHGDDEFHFAPSIYWAQGGPIIERDIAKVERFSDALWEATAYTKDAQDIVQSGPTLLIAAMRCYVASRVGDEIELPEEMKEVMA
jgi:hypothetical protein